MRFINKIIALNLLLICFVIQVMSAPVDSDNTTSNISNTLNTSNISNNIITKITTTTTTTSKTRYKYNTEDNAILSSCLAVGCIILFFICIFVCCKNIN